MFKKTLLAAFIILANPVFADTAVNDYDCTIDELKGYMEKKTEGLVQRKTALATWEEYKSSASTPTAASSGGATKGGATNPDGTPATEQCDYFWGDIEDIKMDKTDTGGILDDILSGNMSGIVDKAGERITTVTDGMIDEIKKGLCKRLSTENVKKTAYKYGNGAMKDATGGYGLGDVTDPDLNGFVNDALKGSYGNTGKLINVFDPNVDAKRGSAIMKEGDRQMRSIMEME
jgi:hypothetical protein